jgi:hypothetical protein
MVSQKKVVRHSITLSRTLLEAEGMPRAAHILPNCRNAINAVLARFRCSSVRSRFFQAGFMIATGAVSGLF